MTEKQKTGLDTKVKMLYFKLHQTDEIVENRERQSLERHQSSIASIVSAVDTLKSAVEEKKCTKGESENTIKTWSGGIEQHLEKADQATKRVQSAIQAIDMEEQEKRAFENHKQQIEFEREILEQKAKFEKDREQQKLTTQTTEECKSSSAAKLPKLPMTKFNGKIEEWLPFWGKFTSEIDSSNLAPLTKFGYLKELLEKHVRKDIDGLPFTDEGYTNAKAILEAEYGQPTEIVKAYIKNIMELPIITGANPIKIKEFYKQLRFNVQSLGTLGRLADVKGNVRCTLDKLKGIKADLVRGNEGWKDWGFKDLLKKWTQIHPVEEIAVEKLEKDQTGKRNQQFKPSLPIFDTHQSKPRSGNQCVYCEDDNHRAINCTKVTSVHERQKILSEKKLCFNCTGTRHRADECKSKLRCQICDRSTRPFVTSKKTKPIHSLSPQEFQPGM